MCITSSPAVLSKTILLAHTTVMNGESVNILGYQNTADSQGPCGMLLPIPSKDELSAANCIDFSAAPDIFENYAGLVANRSRGLLSFSISEDRSIEIFDCGSYTMIRAQRASDIPSVLHMVPIEKRPAANIPLFEQMDRWYPGFQFVFCCWNGNMKAEPMMWWYRPLDDYAGYHFLPGLDAHDGGLPDLNDVVIVDHTIVIGVKPRSEYQNAAHVLSKAPKELQQWLPNNVNGDQFTKERMRNGDWKIPHAFQSLGMLTQRVPPPAA